MRFELVQFFVLENVFFCLVLFQEECILVQFYLVLSMYCEKMLFMVFNWLFVMVGVWDLVGFVVIGIGSVGGR